MSSTLRSWGRGPFFLGGERWEGPVLQEKTNRREAPEQGPAVQAGPGPRRGRKGPDPTSKECEVKFHNDRPSSTVHQLPRPKHDRLGVTLRSGSLGRADAGGEDEGKRGTLPHLAFHPNRSMMHPHELPGEREA